MDNLPYLNPAHDRRVAFITAGNSGVGWYTAYNLYLHGFVVYLAGRSRMRCMKSIHEVEVEAKKHVEKQKTKPVVLGELHYLELDLSSLHSVVAAVSAFSNLEKNLNILINNTGVMGLPCSTTLDSLEIQLQTNFVAPFLLTTKFLPLLERTADLYPNIDPPRMIYLTSTGHHLAFRYFNLSSAFDYRPNAVFTWFRYAMAKTAGIHMVKMLALRNPRILCLSVEPGFIMNTNYFIYWTRLPIVGIVFWCLFQLFGYLFGISVEQGAAALVRCATDPTLTIENDNGANLNSVGQKIAPSKVARNMDFAARSWIWTVHQLEKRHIDIST